MKNSKDLGEVEESGMHSMHIPRLRNQDQDTIDPYHPSLPFSF